LDRRGTNVEEQLVEVFRAQRQGLWGFLARGWPAAAEDLLQETFLRAWGHREDLEGPDVEATRDGMRRYLWRVARNLAIDEIRTRHRRGDAALAEGTADRLAAPGARNDPSRMAEFEQARRLVRETLETLPNERVRRCLQLWLDDKEIPEISEELGLGGGQVRGLLQRGRAELVRRAAARVTGPERETGSSTGGST